MLFATYGLLEIAYRVPTVAIEPRFNCLEYLRLTKLGEYVFGLSAVWKSFYAGIENRCYPLLSPGKGYTVMKILPGNNDLLRILSTDKYIREHTIRAERNHILIETKALAKVKDKLRGYGYLI